jgi:hypothetical protein
MPNSTRERKKEIPMSAGRVPGARAKIFHGYNEDIMKFTH